MTDPHVECPNELLSLLCIYPTIQVPYCLFSAVVVLVGDELFIVANLQDCKEGEGQVNLSSTRRAVLYRQHLQHLYDFALQDSTVQGSLLLIQYP